MGIFPFRPRRVAENAAAALLIAAAFLITPGLAPPASAACPSAEVLFARGTDEPPGVGKVGQAFINSLRRQTLFKTIGAYAVKYPANRDFMAAAQGANDASNHIQQMAKVCPRTKLVLGGYSQGAAVMDIVAAAPMAGLGFTKPLPAQAGRHVAAVALFGNPTNRTPRLIGAINPDFKSKIIDVCNPGDPICSGGIEWNAHVSYVPGWTSRAARVVARRI